MKGDLSGYWSVHIDEKIELYFASRKRI
ncbi:hypothetical protein [Oribacterium sinus]